MSEYIKLSTGEYPLFEGDIRIEHPEISEALTAESFPCPPTFARVQNIQPPEFNPDTHRLYADTPIQTENGWQKVWRLRTLNAEERQHHIEFLALLQEQLQE